MRPVSRALIALVVAAMSLVAVPAAANLARYQAVIWLPTTGDVLNSAQQTAFESYVANGGGYVGVHAAADTEYDWPWYGELVGAYFASHPATQRATVTIEDRASVSTQYRYSRWDLAVYGTSQ
ncbi:ThuA domain-containing protein [Streptomyces sp. NPDC094034]|uniref:ThuA domain-containing protein n=1 Tax=Streptomyces sp. NPDC094034 TaxID=3155309 RepID=UPI003316FF25